MLVTDKVGVVICRTGIPPHGDWLSYDIPGDGERAIAVNQALESYLGQGFRVNPYPEALHKPELAVWRSGNTCLVAAKHEGGGIQTVEGEIATEVMQDMIDHKECFLPYFSLSALELANWIDNQTEECWWSVDGDSLLTGRLDFPCPGDELSAELRRIDKPLLLLDKNQSFDTEGQEKRAGQLDELVSKEEDGSRVLQFCWKHAAVQDWILVEDEETSESSSSSGSTSSSSP